MPDEKKLSSERHTMIVEQRERASITGVTDVLSFDEENVVIETEMGMLNIRGINLHVNKLNLEKGELEIDGEIDSFVYNDRDSYGKPGNSLFSKIFR